MSYNGSGTFLINSTGQPVVTGTVISSTAFNALTADLATGLSTAITKDGQTTTTARIPFAQGVSSTLVTDATSATTGSIITAGGISTQKALWVGTTSNFAGAMTAAAGTFSGAVSVNSLVVNHATFPEIDLNVGASTKVFMYYDNANTRMRFGTNAASSTFELYSGNAVKALTFDASANASFTGTLGVTGDATFKARISQALTPSSAEYAVRSTGQTTGWIAVDMSNTGGNYIIAGENSTGNNLIIGDSAYDMCIRGPSGIAFSANAGATQHMRLTSSGNLLVGRTSTVTPPRGGIVSAYFQYGITATYGGSSCNFSNGGIDFDATNLYVLNGSSVGVYLPNGNTSWSSYSDLRLKDVTGTYTNALDDISKLEAIKFTWKKDDKKKSRVGLSAQSVLLAVPEAVDKVAVPNSADDTEYLSVTYTDIIPLLVASVQELTTRLAALESK